MRRTLSFVPALLMAFAGCAQEPVPLSPEQAEVQAAWAEFKSASLAGDGETAATRVTNATHEYYDEVRRLALQAGREELESYVFAKRLTVLGMRMRVSPDRLEAMSGRELFVHAVDQGWIGKTSATDEDIQAVTVTGDHARAEATKSGEPTGIYLHFIKEDGVWKLDMMQMMKMVDVAFGRMIQQSGQSEAELLKTLLEAMTGKALADDVWTPPRPPLSGLLDELFRPRPMQGRSDRSC